MIEEVPQPFLSFARFRFTLRVISRISLPSYKGAVFRGAFGNAFRRLVCMTPKTDCRSCALRDKCLYAALFEPAAPACFPDAGKFSQAPRPYVLNPPLTTRRNFHPGETLDFELVLVGPAIDALPYFLHIFMDMGRRGLGRERGKYHLTQVDHLVNGAAAPIYDGRSQLLRVVAPEIGSIHNTVDAAVTQVTLRVLTPLRLKEKGDLVTHLNFPLLFRALAQRLGLLAAFYGNGADPPDFTSLLDRSNAVTTVSQNLCWHDWERYSRRQDAAMKFGGLKGSITFTGPLAPFLPYLRLGTAINIGQATTFGLGKFQIVDVGKKISKGT